MKHVFTFGLFALVLCIPFNTHAYFTTAQHAFTVDNKTAVFTIEFSFGHGKHDVLIPIQANQAGPSALTDAVSYVINDAKGNPFVGNVVAIILSKAAVKNGFYVVPKGKSAKFTLLVIATPAAAAANSYATQVTSLPFNFDGSQQLHLNPSELKYYKTPFLALYKALFVFPTSAQFTVPQ